MTMKSGWCLDEHQYRRLGSQYDTYADYLHNTCRCKETCDCNHEGEVQ